MKLSKGAYDSGMRAQPGRPAERLGVLILVNISHPITGPVATSQSRSLQSNNNETTSHVCHSNSYFIVAHDGSEAMIEAPAKKNQSFRNGILFLTAAQFGIRVGTSLCTF